MGVLNKKAQMYFSSTVPITGLTICSWTYLFWIMHNTSHLSVFILTRFHSHYTRNRLVHVCYCGKQYANHPFQSHVVLTISLWADLTSHMECNNEQATVSLFLLAKVNCLGLCFSHVFIHLKRVTVFITILIYNFFMFLQYALWSQSDWGK